MINKIETRSFYIDPGVTCLCRLPVPDLKADPNQACAMGNSVMEKSENIDQFMTNILFPQYIRSVKRAIAAYLAADLPEKYLDGHTVELTVLDWWDGQCAYYADELDIIVIDADTLNIGRRDLLPGHFVYGHMLGKRIMHFRPYNRVHYALSDVCAITGINSRELATTVLCDAFGSLICKDETSRFDVRFTDLQREGLQKTALQLAWST